MEPTDLTTIANRLYERIKIIAFAEGIPGSKLIWEEVNFFIAEHHDHGGYELNFHYGQKGEEKRLQMIYLECRAFGLINLRDCSHNNPETPEGLHYSVIYSTHPPVPGSEVYRQAARRRLWRMKRQA